MNPQRQRISSLKKALREAAQDEMPPKFIENLKNLLAEEEKTLAASREPGQNRTVSEIELDEVEE